MIKSVLILVLFLLTTSVSVAQERKQVLTIVDKRFEQPLEFNVVLPKSYFAKPDKRYVLLFDFHPYSHTYLSGLHDWMSHNGEWPWLETIIVTPVYGNAVGKIFDPSGNSTPLVDFFGEQLIPEIDKNYRTNGFRIISGFRTNGTIVLSTLLNKPELFSAYIAVSPELNNDYAQILSKAAANKKIPEASYKSLLFAHASTIKEDHQMASYQILNQSLSALMSDNQYTYQNFGEHYFMSLPALSVISGIEVLFSDIHRGLAADSVISQQGVQAIVAHYQTLSEKKYGFEVSPKRSIETLGFSLLEHNPKKGLKVLKENISLFPEDAYTHHALARAYDQLGNIDKAIEHQKQANELAKSMLTWHSKRQQRYLDEYTAKRKSLNLDKTTN